MSCSREKYTSWLYAIFADIQESLILYKSYSAVFRLEIYEILAIFDKHNISGKNTTSKKKKTPNPNFTVKKNSTYHITDTKGNSFIVNV
jgi:hypothetical protein